ncbi:hypothetical protein DAEQUDRAFT_770173 [Daedalea quercina L-15889]|uniref:Uncharacterized protein n=1 Tax=Daedalea quercina L-15889 TaxID=1314783 RepID=A0A165L493_9APHY|nr:hypothetical protein DAEQUDRAFT_770173 [Daedalea quercina L-15889]
MLIIPQEFQDDILQIQSLSVDDLKACSLVCRAWLPWTRGRLFETVGLSGEEDCVAFKAILEPVRSEISSGIARCIRRVTPSDLTIGIIAGEPRHASGPALALRQLFSLLPEVENLSMKDTDRSVLWRPADLLTLAAAFPTLSALSLSHVKWKLGFEDNTRLDRTDVRPPVLLRSLRVYKSHNARGVLSGLLAPPFKAKLTRLEWALYNSDYEEAREDIWLHEEDEALLLSRMLQESGSALEELRVRTACDDMFLESIDASNNDMVQELVFNITCVGERDPGDGNESRAVPNFLQRVAWRPLPFDPDFLDWGTTIDTALVSPQLTLTVPVNFAFPTEPEEMPEIMEHLGTLLRKRLLRQSDPEDADAESEERDSGAE